MVTGLVLVGAWGRMGRAIEHAAEGDPELRVAARVGRDRSERSSESGAGAGPAGYAHRPVGDGGAPSWSALVGPGEVVVEFSSPEGFRQAVAACAERSAPLVSGTTALGPDDERRLADLARRVPVLRASNFSLGILALRRALAAALAGLPERWDVEIIERHHRGKADSPSGTALTIAQDVQRARGGDARLRHGREGRVGPRPAGEVGMHALRGGTWVGDHTVVLAGDGESLELRHVAEDRTAFAHGVLAAARFVATAEPGRYELEDVLATHAPRV